MKAGVPKQIQHTPWDKKIDLGIKWKYGFLGLLVGYILVCLIIGLTSLDVVNWDVTMTFAGAMAFIGLFQSDYLLITVWFSSIAIFQLAGNYKEFNNKQNLKKMLVKTAFASLLFFAFSFLFYFFVLLMIFLLQYIRATYLQGFVE